MAFEGVDKEISRRQAISLLAVAGAGVMLGCGGGTKQVPPPQPPRLPQILHVR